MAACTLAMLGAENTNQPVNYCTHTQFFHNPALSRKLLVVGSDPPKQDPGE